MGILPLRKRCFCHFQSWTVYFEHRLLIHRVIQKCFGQLKTNYEYMQIGINFSSRDAWFFLLLWLWNFASRLCLSATISEFSLERKSQSGQSSTAGTPHCVLRPRFDVIITSYPWRLTTLPKIHGKSLEPGHQRCLSPSFSASTSKDLCREV